jgi:hypothetical protein
MTNRENIHEVVQFIDGAMTITVDVEPSSQTVRLTLDQMCLLFEKDKSTISRHIKNVFKEGEVSQISGVAKNATGPNVIDPRTKCQNTVECYPAKLSNEISPN